MALYALGFSMIYRRIDEGDEKGDGEEGREWRLAAKSKEGGEWEEGYMCDISGPWLMLEFCSFNIQRSCMKVFVPLLMYGSETMIWREKDEL